MNIAITGATGFIGHYILRHLSAAGHRLRCWFRPDSNRTGLADIAASIEWVLGDLNDQPSSERLVAGCDAVVHAALYRPGTGFRGAEGDIVTFVERNVV